MAKVKFTLTQEQAHALGVLLEMHFENLQGIVGDDEAEQAEIAQMIRQTAELGEVVANALLVSTKKSPIITADAPKFIV